jgi:hypothetical protein
VWRAPASRALRGAQAAAPKRAPSLKKTPGLLVERWILSPLFKYPLQDWYSPQTRDGNQVSFVKENGKAETTAKEKSECWYIPRAAHAVEVEVYARSQAAMVHRFVSGWARARCEMMGENRDSEGKENRTGRLK